MERSPGARGVVVDAILVYQQDKRQVVIPLDTLAWFAWLETASTFSFVSEKGLHL